MPVKYPITTITNAGKYAFCYRVQEALRLKHNEMGASLKNNEITQKEFDTWLETWYDPKFEILIGALLALRTVIKMNNPQGINLEEVIKS